MSAGAGSSAARGPRSPLISRLLFALPAETAHAVAVGGLRLVSAAPGVRARLRERLAPQDPALVTHALGLTFPNPVGLAAGFDKDGLAFAPLGALGFGFVEVGTVTARAQPGNPKPRLFRLPADRALINRMGFNNRGAHALRKRLAAPDRSETLLGVNVGKTKATPPESAIADYVWSVSLLAPLADYLVVNVSSPNTPGLRSLQRTEELRPLLEAVCAAAADGSGGRVPVLVKIAPDLSDEEVDGIADLALDIGLDGIVATNTTVARRDLRSPPQAVAGAGAGGLSGAPLQRRSLAVLARLHGRVQGRLVLVAAGGIETSEDAWRCVTAGATLVQLYTGFVYGGPLTPARIARGLASRARAEGFSRVQDAVGVSHRTSE